MKTKLFVPGWSHSIKMLWLIEQKCFIWIMLMSSCICSPPRGSPTGTVMQMLPNSMISHGLPGLAVMLCIFPYGQVIARLMVNIPQRISPCSKAGLNTTNKVQCPYSFPLEMEELLFIKHFNFTQYTEMSTLWSTATRWNSEVTPIVAEGYSSRFDTKTAEWSCPANTSALSSQALVNWHHKAALCKKGEADSLGHIMISNQNNGKYMMKGNHTCTYNFD